MADEEGYVEREPTGETTKSGAPKEHFGHGHAALSEAGKKGAAISASQPPEKRHERAVKAAQMRRERYGDASGIAAPPGGLAEHSVTGDPEVDELLEDR